MLVVPAAPPPHDAVDQDGVSNFLREATSQHCGVEEDYVSSSSSSKHVMLTPEDIEVWCPQDDMGSNYMMWRRRDALRLLTSREACVLPMVDSASPRVLDRPVASPLRAPPLPSSPPVALSLRSPVTRFEWQLHVQQKLNGMPYCCKPPADQLCMLVMPPLPPDTPPPQLDSPSSMSSSSSAMSAPPLMSLNGNDAAVDQNKGYVACVECTHDGMPPLPPRKPPPHSPPRSPSFVRPSPAVVRYDEYGEKMLVKDAFMFRTALCRNWGAGQTCPHGWKCQFAHGIDKLRMKGGPLPGSAFPWRLP